MGQPSTITKRCPESISAPVLPLGRMRLHVSGFSPLGVSGTLRSVLHRRDRAMSEPTLVRDLMELHDVLGH